MKKLVLLVAAFLFLVPQAILPQIASRSAVTISGRVLDRTGKPMADAVVVYSNTIKGNVYQIRTDKNGDFSALGVLSGYYKIEITAPNGKRVYSGSRSVGTYTGADPISGMIAGENTPLPTNVLHVDLSTVRPSGEMLSSDGAEKVSAADLKAVRDENARDERLSVLRPELQIALDDRDWPHAVQLLKELILIDPNRWEYYQNLGTIQNTTSQYEAAVQTFARGIELARKGPKTPTPQARATISGLLISQAEAYRRLQKLDEALACYRQAAVLTAQPALPHYFACTALENSGKLREAIEECDQAIAADPRQWQAYQAKGAVESVLGNNDAALAAYEGGIQAAQGAILANLEPAKAKEGMGQMLNAEANVYVQLRRTDQAIPLFSQAAEASIYSALPYYNLCALFYSRHDAQAAVSACDKAIASDPGLADAYFVKGSALFEQGKLQQVRYQAPEEARAALNKYLELSPEGRHSTEARTMLEKLNARK